MKQLVLTVALALITTIGMAQKGNITNAAMAYKDSQENAQDMEQSTKDLLEAKKYVDLACAHPDTKESAKALMYKGKVYMELSMKVANATDKAMYGDLKAEELAEEGYNALVKSKAVDKKGRYTDDVDQYASFLRATLSNAGIAAYEKQDYETAMAGLMGAAKFGEIIGQKDLDWMRFAGYAAINSENWTVAEETFTYCIENEHFVGESLGFLTQALIENGKTEEADKAVADAIAKYPKDVDVLVNGVDYYATNDRNEEAEGLITTAVELDPTNTILVYNSGIIYEKLEKFEEAEAAYRKTLELDPAHVNAKYSLGILFFNKGADANNEANSYDFNSPGYQGKYDAKIAESKDYWKTALPFLEEAAEAEPKDLIILGSLKAVYGKLSMTDKFKETKAKMAELGG